MRYVTREFYHRASSTDEGIDTQAWLRSHKFITEGTPSNAGVPACPRVASGSYTLGLVCWSLREAGKVQPKRTGSAVTDGYLHGETWCGSCGKNNNNNKIGQIAEASKGKGVHPLRGEPWLSDLGKDNLSSCFQTQHGIAANKKKVIWIDYLHTLAQASSLKGKEAEGKVHFGRTPASDRNLLLKDSTICLSSVCGSTSCLKESSSPIHPL